jgi:hypothetical protein
MEQEDLEEMRRMRGKNSYSIDIKQLKTYEVSGVWSSI